MPDTIQGLLKYVPIVQAKVKQDTKKYGRKLRKASVFKKFRVQTIPVRPEIDSVAQPGVAAEIAEASISLSSLYPLRIIPLNVGSNRGFHNVFKDFYDEYVRPPVNKDRYFMLLLDAALYYSLIKVRGNMCE